MMCTLETTPACRRTPAVRFVLEELGVAHEVVVRAPGHFHAVHHTIGPLVRDGELVVLELNAVLRHLARTRGRGTLLPVDDPELAEVDRWMEVQATLRAVVARLAAVGSEVPAEDDRAQLARCLAALDAALADRDYLLGRFTVADCPAVMFRSLASFGVDPGQVARIAPWAARVAARPAWRRVQETMAREQGAPR